MADRPVLCASFGIQFCPSATPSFLSASRLLLPPMLLYLLHLLQLLVLRRARKCSSCTVIICAFAATSAARANSRRRPPFSSEQRAHRSQFIVNFSLTAHEVFRSSC